MTENDLDRKIKSSRDSRIIELKCRGLTNVQVSIQLKNENYRKVSESTIKRFWTKLKKEPKEVLTMPPIILEEIVRQQLADISLEDDRSEKMKHRGKLLAILQPPRPQTMEITAMPSLVVHFDEKMKSVPKDDGAARDPDGDRSKLQSS